MIRLVLVRMPGQVALVTDAAFHWPPRRGAASMIAGTRPWAPSQRLAARPPGPAPITATAVSGIFTG
ncbi:hypothetical protein ABIE77_000585 [Sinorhizobium fredii]